MQKYKLSERQYKSESTMNALQPYDPNETHFHSCMLTHNKYNLMQTEPNAKRCTSNSIHEVRLGANKAYLQHVLPVHIHTAHRYSIV